MDIRLVVERGGKRKTLRLKSAVSVLGRAKGNTVRIPSAEVSRQHCRIMARDGHVEVQDLDSVNGTLLNGRRINMIEIVRPGDRVQIGPVIFGVEYELTPDALEKLRAADEPVGDFLDGLADGSVLASDLDDDVELELDVPDLELLDDDVEELKVPETDTDKPLKPDFSFNQPWNMPDEGDLRDILSKMEEDDRPPPPPDKKKKKKK